MHVNVSNGVIGFWGLFLAPPYALANVDGFAVGANHRMILGVVLYTNCQGFTDAKASSGKQSIKHPVPATDLRENIRDFSCFNGWSVLILRLDQWQVDEIVIPLPGIESLSIVVACRSDHNLRNGDDVNDGFGS